MTKSKDSTAIKSIILELAKANTWLSRDDLKKRTGKEIQTIKNYLRNDISYLIDTQDFIEYVKRNTGKGKTIIEKYKLKNDFDNLSAIFEYITDKKNQYELMRTDYYKDLISQIMAKFEEYGQMTQPTRKNYTIEPDTSNLSSQLSTIIQHSPCAVSFILNLNKRIDKLESIFNYSKMFGLYPYIKVPQPHATKRRFIYSILEGLFYSDFIELQLQLVPDDFYIKSPPFL